VKPAQTSSTMSLNSASSSSSASESPESLIHRLPPELLERIFGSMPFENVAMTRLVCHRFNRSCQSILNQGFCKVDRLHTSFTKWVKSHLPRRESERRSHPLARHCDILSGIETRLSLLSMTYTKYIESGSSCFIPGKVLDEVVRILNLVQRSAKSTLEGQSSNLPRAHELLQELRDISSMAMEHFDEKIVPIIRHRNQLQPLQPFPSCTSHSSTASSPPRSFAEAQHIYRDRKLHHGQPAFHAPHPTLTPSPSICGSLSPPLPPLLDVYGNVSEPGSSASGSDSPTVVTTSMPQISHLPPCPSLTQVTHGEFAVFKKKMSSMKRKADETNKTMEETIAQQSTLIQTQNLTIQAQGSKIAKLERRIDRMTRKFLDCNAKVEDILRCGQTGIKLKRKEGAEVGLLSGDESEASPNPSVQDNDGDDDDVDANHGGNVVKDPSFPLVTGFSAGFLAIDSMSQSTSASPRLAPSLIGVGNLTRSPIKLRLRQTDVDGDGSNMASSSSSSRSVEEVDDVNKNLASKILDDDADDEADKVTEMNGGKGGKSFSSKRKGKSSTAGSKRKKAEKQAAHDACTKDIGASSGASTSCASASQRKRQKL